MMIDSHVHLLHSAKGEYTFELFERIVTAAIENGIDEIYLLEHTHQYCEFEQVYKPIAAFNQYQNDWLARKMGETIDKYLRFTEMTKKKNYPIKIKFGLEACYIPKTENLLVNVLNEYSFDFITGSVHYKALASMRGFARSEIRRIRNEVSVNEDYFRRRC